MPRRAPLHRTSLLFKSPFLVVPLLALALLAGAPTAWAGDAPSLPAVDSLDHRFQAAYEAGDHEKALGAAEALSELLYPRYVGALYNAAAMNCRLGRTKEAYEWLQQALDAGYGDFAHLREDEDFASIRSEDRFRTMVRRGWLKQYLAMLERADRDAFQKPDEVMAALALRPGERVADIGAGSGYFTLRAARAVGGAGKVWALDIRQEMLDFIRERLAAEGITNVELGLVPKDDPRLPKGGVDTVLLVDTWHYIRDPEYAKKVRDGLAPGGRVVVIDYRPKPFEERPWGPPPEQQTPREELDAHMAAASLVPVRSHDFLPEQYFVEYQAR